MRLSERALRRIIREEVITIVEAAARAYSRPEEVRVVSPFMWYADRLFVVAEYEKFVGGPKARMGFYTSRGESVPGTEDREGSWQPCLGINKSDGWIKKTPDKWAEPDSLLGMVSGVLGKKYDLRWQREKRQEIFSELRRKAPRGASRNEISDGQIDQINGEFKRHGALFEREFVDKRLGSEEEAEEYREFSRKFSWG